MRVVRRADHPAQTTTVRDLMSHSIVAGDPRQTLVEAALEMRSHRVSALAVLQDDEIVGIITEHDLLRAIADGRSPRTTHLSEYMTRSPVTVEAGELATRAAATMVKRRVRHLPVTADGALAGFISARDLLLLEPWPSGLKVGEAW